jgi:hypothetical protein
MTDAMDDGLDQVWRIAQGAPNVNARSKAYRWMMRNYNEFSARLESDFPGWPGIALGLAQIGILGRGKRRLTGEQVRKTWWKVRFDHAKMETLGVDGSAAVVTPAPKAPPFRKSRRRKDNPIIPKKKPAVRRALAPSLVIPDPPVMPPGVRMVETKPADQVDEDAAIYADKPAARSSKIDDIRAKLNRGQTWLQPSDES